LAGQKLNLNRIEEGFEAITKALTLDEQQAREILDAISVGTSVKQSRVPTTAI